MATLSEEQCDLLRDMLKVIRETRKSFESWGYLDETRTMVNPDPIPSVTPITSPPPTKPPDPPDFDFCYHSDMISAIKAEGETTKAPLFPKFDGTFLREWIYNCEQFFMLHSTQPEQKIRLASLHMEGKALQWHHTFISNRFGILPSWTEYIIAVFAKFGGKYDDLLAELMNLKQCDDSVEAYLAKFERALFMFSLPTTHALEIFLTNMRSHLATRVRQYDVTTVSDAARIAKLYESSLQHSSATQTRAPFNPNENHSENVFDNETDKIEDEELQIKQHEADVETVVMNEDEQPLEFVDDLLCDDKELVVFTAGEIADTAVETIQEEKSNPEKESQWKVSDQIQLSQCQVPFSSLEPSRSYHKNSLVVVNDLSSNLRCVIDKSNGFLFEPKFNSLDEEKLSGFKLGELLKNERWLSSVCLLGLMNMGCWTQLLKQKLCPKSWKFKYRYEAITRVMATTKQMNVEQIHNGIVKDVKKLACVRIMKQDLRGMQQLTCGDVSFYLKHKWRSRLLPSFSGMEFCVENIVIFTGPIKIAYLVLMTAEMRDMDQFYDMEGRKDEIQDLDSRHKWVDFDNIAAFGHILLVMIYKHTHTESTYCGGNVIKWRHWLDINLCEAEKNDKETSTGCCYGPDACLNLMADVTAGIIIDDFSSVCKFLLDVVVFNLLAEQSRDYYFFGFLSQWKWHPPEKLFKFSVTSIQSLILEDKDLLKEGVLLQEISSQPTLSLFIQ